MHATTRHHTHRGNVTLEVAAIRLSHGRDAAREAQLAVDFATVHEVDPLLFHATFES